MQTILSTKKLSEKNKVKLENAGFLVVEKNFIKTKSVSFSIEDTNENLIFTSKNAVKSILPFKIKSQTTVFDTNTTYNIGKSKHIISYLQDFLFTPERARCPIGYLSGGERNRLLLDRKSVV